MKSDAMEKAYEKYQRELYLYALSLCRQEDRAKDLVNETFYKAFIASNIPKGSFKYWLFRVLKNQFIDIKRKDGRSTSMVHYKHYLADHSNSGPADSYIKQERNERLYSHLMKLEPQNYREIIYLYYYGGMSLKEIMKTMELSNSNAKTTLYRARKKLGKILKEDTYEF